MPAVPLARLLGVAALAALLFFAGWGVRGWHAEAELSGVRAAHERQLRAISDTATQAAGDALAKQTELTQANARIDALQGELTDAQSANSRLRTAVADGSRRVLVRASCPASGGGSVPQTAAAAGVDPGAQVELTAAAGRNVLDLRAGILADQAKLSALQRYATEVCGTLGAPP